MELDLSAWFLALLVPTLVFKAAYVLALAGGDLQVAQSAGPGAPEPTWWLLTAYLFPADVIEVALVTCALAVLGRVVTMDRVVGLVVALTTLVVAYGTLELLAIRELGALLTSDTLVAGVNWAITSPLSVPAFVTPRRLGMGLVAVSWCAAPVALAFVLQRFGKNRVARLVVPCVLLAIAAFALVRAPWTVLPWHSASPFRQGFWRSAAVALFRADTAEPPDVANAPSADDVMAAYADLVYPLGTSGTDTWQFDIPPDRRTARHVVLILLETAPSDLYDVDNGDLPTLSAMRSHAIVADRHYTSAPMSSLALYSLLTGTYPRPGAPIGRYGNFASDSLPEHLRRRGYVTGHVDSYDVSWNGPDEERTIRSMGVESVIDARDAPRFTLADPFAMRVAQDRWSLERAREFVIDAEGTGRQAFISVATHLGHFDWPAPDGRRLSAGERIAEAARAIDGLIGEFLGEIEDAGLTEDVIVVVTGDHGLRFGAEFAALDRPVEYGDATYRVPMIIYAPGLMAEPRRIGHVTSHVDVAATLLDLTGTARQGVVQHGSNMLDPRLGDRVTFLASGAYPGLAPVDALHWRGRFYRWHQATDDVVVRVGEPPADTAGPTFDALAAVEVRARIVASQALFNQTAAFFLRRARDPR